MAKPTIEEIQALVDKGQIVTISYRTVLVVVGQPKIDAAKIKWDRFNAGEKKERKDTTQILLDVIADGKPASMQKLESLAIMWYLAHNDRG